MDLERENEFRWIDENIDISDFADKLPGHIKDMIRDAEKADKEDNFPVYAQVCDDLEICAKLLVPDVLTMKQWHDFCDKYTII